MAQRNRKRLDAAALWEYALRAVSGRAHSAGELREKLRQRAERAADVDAVVARLKEHGYLDDRRFAETFAMARRDNQGFGGVRVMRDLRARRVAPKIAEQAVRQAYSDVDETELIESYLARKYRRVALGEFLSEPKNLAAAYRRLRLAGFTSGNVIRVLKRHASGANLLEECEPPEEERGES